jgi:two-component system, LytTR family, sensor kinase
MNEIRPLNLTSRRFYWSCQLGGWVLYVLIVASPIILSGKFNGTIAFGLTLIFMQGILLTEALRWLIVRLQWLRLPVAGALPRVLVVNILMGLIMALIKSGLDRIQLDTPGLFLYTAQYAFVFFLWSVIYFLVHFLENYKNAEIENLRWEASIREAELNKLKSQLNPHFMFNAMNSIRALVGENPNRAKEAVTQLANLLRNTLQMGKQKMITFGQELEIVKDYLALESVRLEERLRIEIKIIPGCESAEVPPLMIQTLVENGIKHGIAQLPEGGTLSLYAAPENDGIRITIRNSGRYDETKKPESGFGLRNTMERLHLLYGGNASFSLKNENVNTVLTDLFIPGKSIPANRPFQKTTL